MSVNGFNPSVTLPSHDNIAESAFRTVVLQGSQIVAREGWRQLVEHRVVGTIPLTFVAGIDVLIAERLTEDFHLLVETILSHHQREVETSLAFPCFQSTQRGRF